MWQTVCTEVIKATENLHVAVWRLQVGCLVLYMKLNYTSGQVTAEGADVPIKEGCQSYFAFNEFAFQRHVNEKHSRILKRSLFKIRHIFNTN